MADLSLTDAVYTAKPLLDAIRIPRQIVIHHEMCALKVNALSGYISRHKYFNGFVLFEYFFSFFPILTS